MKQVYLCPIVEAGPLGDYFTLTVSCPALCALAAPGQFVHVKCGEKPLRRPISIHNIQADRLTMIYEAKGEGTQWLSRQSVGTELDIIGPLGKGFPKVEGPVLVVGGGIGVPPMYFTARSVGEADAVLGFRSADKALLVEEFQSVCRNVKLMSDDGTLGQKGFVAQGVAEMLKARTYSAVFACGPKIMLKTTYDAAKAAGVPCYVSMEERMGCGIGACLVCAVKIYKDGEAVMGHVCKDGPVFRGEEVVWDA
ncbi:MAG: dihydroorotate dehydrogenase electron transfer subunit [Oscillospiraceae bacterium]|nr:dihydroorotate dehydrogenase electron transfer subunit [Oscillospiraceae bacterium]